MILEKMVVGAFGTNCYIFGSDASKEVVIIDPGAEPKRIIAKIEELDASPIAAILTHGHIDHMHKVGRIIRHFQIPLMFNEREVKICTTKKADHWLKENDEIPIGEYTLYVLETPGHSPGSICLYTSDVKDYKGIAIDGIIFTGDLLFRRSIGRSDLMGGNQHNLFNSIRTKIMHNPKITDKFIVFPGHMGITTIGEEKNMNMYKNYFL
ncbi:MAG: MBL fold metallo-hydrolase [Promethearchaeota archaeon]